MNRLNDKVGHNIFLHPHKRSTNHFRQFNIIMIVLLGLYFVASLVMGRYFYSLHIVHFPLEFVIYGMMLLGIATFNNDSITVATVGFMGILIYKLSYNSNFELFERLMGVNDIYNQITNREFQFKEWFVIFNVIGTFLGLPIMAYHFMKSNLIEIIIPFMRRNWTTPLLLLIAVILLSALTNDLTAALIGVVSAIILFNRQLHIGYIVAIVASANIGNIGNISDILPDNIISSANISEYDILLAYVGGIVAFLVFGPIASIAQYKKSPLIVPIPNHRIFLNQKHLTTAIAIIVMSVLTKQLFNASSVGIWVAIAVSTFFVYTDWKVLEKTLPCTVFMLLLIFASALMPMEELPNASTITTGMLGLMSSTFNNIPLMKLALAQGGHSLPLLIYAISFGGSLLWFGSISGIAITNVTPEAKAVSKWLYYGWFIVIAYFVGFFAVYGLEKMF